MDPLSSELDFLRLSVESSATRISTAADDLLRGESIPALFTWSGAGRRETVPDRRRRFARRLPIAGARGVVRYVDVDRVDWIEAANQYVRIHADRASGLLRESMSHLESILDPQRFRRIHRSAIVNLDRVRELWTESSTVHWAVLGDGVRLPVSRRRWDELQAALLGLG